MTLLAELESHLESDVLITGGDVDRYAFNGFKPEAVVRPADAEHAAQAVRTAAEAGACVVPCGSVTKLARYPSPTRPAVMLATERMADVLDYAPRSNGAIDYTRFAEEFALPNSPAAPDSESSPSAPAPASGPTRNASAETAAVTP